MILSFMYYICEIKTFKYWILCKVVKIHETYHYTYIELLMMCAVQFWQIQCTKDAHSQRGQNYCVSSSLIYISFSMHTHMNRWIKENIGYIPCHLICTQNQKYDMVLEEILYAIKGSSLSCIYLLYLYLCMQSIKACRNMCLYE